MPSIKKDYTGKICGTKLVLGLSHFNHHKDPVWNFRCLLCGREATVTAQNLRYPTCRGCYTINHPTRMRPYESLYNAFVHKTSKREYSSDISYEEFVKFTEVEECHYCGSKIVWCKFQTSPTGLKKRKYSHSYYLDRKDNDVGYTADNVVVCCPRCNLSKGGRFSYEEWKQIGRTIRSWSQEIH